MSINIQVLKLKVQKAIMKLPNTIQVFRPIKGEYGEPGEKEFVVELVGQYYSKSTLSTYFAQRINDGGTTTSLASERFMVVVDESSLKVEKNDVFTLKGINYKIIDLGNSLDIYFDFSLERVV